MHQEPKALLEKDILECLPVLQRLAATHVARHQVWTRIGEGQWQGSAELRPDLTGIFIALDHQLRDAGSSFAQSFLAHHPEYNGMVGFPSSGQWNLAHDAGWILRA